jgi:hypothetical protein
VKSASIETLSVAERMVWQISHEASLAPVVAAARGLPDAVEMVVRASGDPRRIHDERARRSGNGPLVRARPPCLPLRHVACAASVRDVEAVRAL